MAEIKRRLLIGMSGASGAPLGVELLKQLQKKKNVETHLIITRGAEMTLLQETDLSIDGVKDLADVFYENDCIGAGPASGSFHMEGMIIVPCSMKTVAGIVSGYSDNLLLRAADVTLKERRKLVLVARESPFSTIHLRNMYEISQMGGIVMPPIMTYYRRPGSVEECTLHMVDRILRQFGLGEDAYEWEGM